MRLYNHKSIRIKKDQHINNPYKVLEIPEMLKFPGQASNHFLNKVYTVICLKKSVGKFQAQCSRDDKILMPQGEVVEWFMALVLKTSVGASPPSVRIRPSPLQ